MLKPTLLTKDTTKIEVINTTQATITWTLTKAPLSLITTLTLQNPALFARN
jgi:hypothetical protein